MKHKYLNLFILFITIGIISILITGVESFWSKGLAYIANNTDKYSVNHSISSDSYAYEINLVNLEENVGKVIFNDGNNKIYISSIDKDDYYYRISFRSSGDYSLKGGTLISGIKHTYNPNQGFSSIMTAKMNVSYNDFETQASLLGVSGINYKDGDDFSFYIMNISDYVGGPVTITLTNLCKNTWTR